MLYNQYKDNRFYGGQSVINFPRTDPKTDRVGEGNCIILVTPNQHKALEALSDERYAFMTSLTKRFFTDTIFREKIGRKRVMSLERAKTDKFFMETQRETKLRYIPYGSRKSILSKKKNCVYDVSRWMELTFSRLDSLPPRYKCAEFIRILTNCINNPDIKDFNKILLIDLDSWTSSARQCVIMNRKLLNNPLSILFFAAIYYPDLLNNFPNVKIMIADRAHGQMFMIDSSFITKKNYPKIKSKMTKFDDLIFSVEDEVSETVATDESVSKEVKAEVIASFKEDMKAELRQNLLGNSKSEDPFKDIDITSEVTDDDFDIEKEMAEAESNELKDEIVDDIAMQDTHVENQIEDIISAITDDSFSDVDDIEDLDEIDTDEKIKSAQKQIKDHVYRQAFTPEKSPKEKARIERLTAGQKSVIPEITLEDVKRKALTPRTTGGYVNTTNPTILDSKFVNFDEEYNKKCLVRNIDSAVKGLSHASSPIFVTEKTVKDSSDSMNLQELYTYKLQDEKGNKYTVSFDVPKIIDGSYVYLNGSKKIIKHQLILKPIVKTGNDTVQLVTSYNKVFIRRQGVTNQNMNRISSFLDKNAEQFKVRTGNCSMLNDAYDVPLDYVMLSKNTSEFSIGDVTFYMSVDGLKKAYKTIAKKELTFDSNTQYPIAIDRKTKTAILINYADSYTDKLMEYFSDADRKKIMMIKRKPRFVCANAKIMKRDLPLILFMLFCEGFASVMKKANIEYEFVEASQRKKYDPMIWDTIELADGFIMWKKVPFRNELLMNGLKRCDLSDFTYDSLEDKLTYISLIAPFYPGNPKFDYALDNYRDFLLDEKTKEILADFEYPTELIPLLVVAAGMLCDNHFKIENNLENMRVRSNEVISDLVYIAMTNAYKQYRQTAYKQKPSRISLKRSIIIDTLLSSDTNMVEEFSTLNPVMEIEKQRGTTFKGLRGIQMARAMTLPRRCYDTSMVGTLAMETSPDANVGVNRVLTLEPAITSTYGYIDSEKS